MTQGLLAHSSEPTDGEEPVTEVVEAEETPRANPVEAGDVATAEEPPDGTECHDRELPLLLGELRPESQQFEDRSGTVAEPVEFGEGVVARELAVDVDELDVDVLARPCPILLGHREVLGRDVAVLPVVLAFRDHGLEREPGAHDDAVDVVHDQRTDAHDELGELLTQVPVGEDARQVFVSAADREHLVDERLADLHHLAESLEKFALSLHEKLLGYGLSPTRTEMVEPKTCHVFVWIEV